MTKKTFSIIYFFSIFAIGILIAISVWATKNTTMCFDTGNVVLFNDKWTNSNNDHVTLPAHINTAEDGASAIMRILSDTVSNSDSIMIKTIHQYVKVYIDNTLIYEYSDAQSDLFPVPGNSWHIVHLLKEYSGKTLRIELSCPTNDSSNYFSSIYYGDEKDFLIKLIKIHLPGIVSCIILFSLIIYMVIVWIALLKQPNSISILYLALFAMHVLIWSIADTEFLQFFTGNSSFLSALTLEALIVVPLPLILYARNNDDEIINKVSNFSIITTVFTLIICNVLHFSHILYLNETIYFGHINIVFNGMLIILGHFVSHIKKNKPFNFFSLNIFGFFLLIIFVGIDMLRYYYDIYSDNALFSRIGLILYIILLSIKTIYNSFDMILLGHKAQMYEHLAYHDILTGISNRTSFEEDLHYYDHDRGKKNILLLSVDLNNLKIINDNYGHSLGDKYISTAAHILSDSFKDIGKAYRIGGDEFVVIIHNYSDSAFLHAYNVMKKKEEAARSDLFNVFSFSAGYAKYNADTDSNLEATLKRADKNMYMEKQAYKKEHPIPEQ